MSISATGEVTTVNTLDRETTASYSLVIEVVDSGTATLSTTTTLSITVIGNMLLDNILNALAFLYNVHFI